MSRKELIMRAATLKVEVIKKETPSANQDIKSWIRFYNKETNKSLKETIENLEKHVK